MSSCDLIFKLEQETDKLKMVIFWIYFRVIIRPSDLQKFTKLYIYIYIYTYITTDGTVLAYWASSM